MSAFHFILRQILGVFLLIAAGSLLALSFIFVRHPGLAAVLFMGGIAMVFIGSRLRRTERAEPEPGSAKGFVALAAKVILLAMATLIAFVLALLWS